MATLPSKDPERHGDVHLLRRAPKAPDSSPPPPSRWQQIAAKLLTGVQVAALLYAFFLLALVAGAEPFTDRAGSGAIAIPGLPWFIRAAITGAVLWSASRAKAWFIR